MNYATGLLLILLPIVSDIGAMTKTESKTTSTGAAQCTAGAAAPSDTTAVVRKIFYPPVGCIIINQPFLLQSVELAKDDFENCIEIKVESLPVFYPPRSLLVGVTAGGNVLRVKASPKTIHVLRRLLAAGMCAEGAESDNSKKLRQKRILKDQDRELFVELKALLKELDLPVREFFVALWNDVRNKLSERKQADAEVAAIFGLKIVTEKNEKA